MKICFPKSKNTQRKIATILSTIDTVIEQTEALIEKYQHIKAGLMHDLCSPTANCAHPANKHPSCIRKRR